MKNLQDIKTGLNDFYEKIDFATFFTSIIDIKSVYPLDNKKMERDFKLERYNNTISHVRSAIIFGLFLVIIYGPLDPFFYGSGYDLYYIWALRYFYMVPSCLIIIWNIYQQDKYDDFAKISFICVLFFASGWPMFIIISSDWTITSYVFPALIMTWFYIFFFLGMDCFQGTKCAIIAGIMFFGGVLLIEIELHLLINLFVASSVIFSLMMLLSFQREYAARQLFRERQNRTQSLIRQTRFLRHQLPQRIGGISSSTELLAPHVQETGREYLKRLIQSADLMADFVDLATRFNEFEVSIRNAPLRIGNILRHIKKTHDDIEGSYRNPIDLFLPDQTVFFCSYDAVTLHLAIENLVRNAVSHGDPSGRIVIKIDIHDSEIFITVENTGPTFPENEETGQAIVPAEPYEALDTTNESPHFGLGIPIVKLVAEHFGGRFFARNRAAGDGVEVGFNIPQHGRPGLQAPIDIHNHARS